MHAITRHGKSCPHADLMRMQEPPPELQPHLAKPPAIDELEAFLATLVRRSMANGWTPGRRQRQAELIRQWKPWEQSTGPRSAEGKATSARNGYRGGERQGRALAKPLHSLDVDYLS